jgi:hypothetical protein
MRLRLPILVAFAAALLLPVPAATAQSCVAPPGTSAIDQYCEVVPNGTGGSSGVPGSGIPGSGGPSTPGVSRPTATALARAGADGRAVADLAGGAQSGRRARRTPATSTTGSPDRSTSPAVSSNVLEAAARSATDQSARVGTAFAVTLLASLLAMAGWGWLRFRRSSVT